MEVNVAHLLVLKYKQTNGCIIVEYEPIINPYEHSVCQIRKLCDDGDSDLEDLKSYIKQDVNLNNIFRNYKYCVDLVGRDQRLEYSQNGEVEKINQAQNLFRVYEKMTAEDFINEEQYTIIQNEKKEIIKRCKEEIKNDSILCGKAYAIEQAYKKSKMQKGVLAYSHRITGWSNPVYKLNENFSVEFITNFGYGNSSYFYTLIKYKNIEIVPFSEWVNYEIAFASQILRYSRSNMKRINDRPVIENKNWIGAMLYAKDACNLAIKNEKAFVDKYILKECETMVAGIEKFLVDKEFTFLDENGNGNSPKKFERNNIEHMMMEFRAEKISGALEFINKIFEFKDFINVDDFITRIENCNQVIQPLLLDELAALEEKLVNFKFELKKSEPDYKKIVSRNEFYLSEKNKIINELVILKKVNRSKIDLNEVLIIMNKKFPEYDAFFEEFKIAVRNYNDLTTSIKIHSEIFNNIEKYNFNITTYFGKDNRF